MKIGCILNNNLPKFAGQSQQIQLNDENKKESDYIKFTKKWFTHSPAYSSKGSVPLGVLVISLSAGALAGILYLVKKLRAKK